jgi:hypothetical protein
MGNDLVLQIERLTRDYEASAAESGAARAVAEEIQSLLQTEIRDRLPKPVVERIQGLLQNYATAKAARSALANAVAAEKAAARENSVRNRQKLSAGRP